MSKKGAPLTILLVEDNPDHAELVKRNLQALPVTNRVIHVENGEAALAYVLGPEAQPDGREHPEPDLVLLDLRLPRIDGLEVLRQIKSDPKRHRIPVVILTSSDADRDIAQAYDFHANSFITKPVDFHDLTKLMQDLGFYWLGWNQHPL